MCWVCCVNVGLTARAGLLVLRSCVVCALRALFLLIG